MNTDEAFKFLTCEGVRVIGSVRSRFYPYAPADIVDDVVGVLACKIAKGASVPGPGWFFNHARVEMSKLLPTRGDSLPEFLPDLSGETDASRDAKIDRVQAVLGEMDAEGREILIESSLRVENSSDPAMRGVGKLNKYKKKKAFSAFRILWNSQKNTTHV